MKAGCEAQCDHVFYGCARQMQGLVWKGADRWCVGGCVQLQKRKKGTRSWKKNIAIKIAQNCKVTVCTRPLWLRLYLPLLPVCPGLLHCLISTLITTLSFYRPHYFCGCTHGDAHMHRSSVCFLLFFSSLASLPGHHLDFDQHHSLEHPFPLSCSSFAVSPSSPAVPLVCLCLCSCGFTIPQFLQKTYITCCSCSQPRSVDSVSL